MFYFITRRILSHGSVILSCKFVGRINVHCYFFLLITNHVHVPVGSDCYPTILVIVHFLLWKAKNSSHAP